jgi:hypothetical protein
VSHYQLSITDYLKGAIEASAFTGVAGGASGGDVEQESVGIAVVANLADVLGIATGSAFAPEFLAAAAPEGGEAALQGLLERGPVHVGKHQDLAGSGVLHDGWHEATLVPVNQIKGWVA